MTKGLEQGRTTGPIRSRMHQVIWIIFAVLCWIFVIGPAVVAVGKANPLPQIILALVFFSLSVWFVRTAFSSVVITDSEVVVHNTLRTHRIALADVKEFEVVRSPVPGQLGNTYYNVKLRSRDGRRLICNAGRHVSEREATKVQGRLNHEVTSRRPVG